MKEEQGVNFIFQNFLFKFNYLGNCLLNIKLTTTKQTFTAISKYQHFIKKAFVTSIALKPIAIRVLPFNKKLNKTKINKDFLVNLSLNKSNTIFIMQKLNNSNTTIETIESISKCTML
jgi:hypothetical protein